jgi:endo-1,3-1,4-beta-glycanase ExoK
MTWTSEPLRAGRAALLAASVIAASSGASQGAEEAAARKPGGAQEAHGASFVENFKSLSKLRWYQSNSWANGDHQGCIWSNRNIRLTKQNALELLLTDRPAKERKYTCAEIQTHDRFGYGTYEVRMRAARAPGVISAFFTYIGPMPDEVPHHEIDFEFIGKDTGKVQLNSYADGKGGNEHWVDLGFDAAGNMADYAFEWLPDRIRWFVNGKQVHEAARVDGKPFPSEPQKIMLSIWNGQGLDDWTGPFAYPGKPLAAAFERVAFTRAGDRCQFEDSIVCRKDQAAAEPTGAGKVQR